MMYAIEVLKRELAEENKPISEEEDDLYGAVASFKKATSLKMAIKILQQAIDNAKEIKSLE